MKPVLLFSKNWAKVLPTIVLEILRVEYKFDCYFESGFINKIAATILGTDLSNLNGKEIEKAQIYKIAGMLKAKAEKQHTEKHGKN